MSGNSSGTAGARGRGQAMVEFALVGPIFVLLILMIVEGALLMNAQVSLDNSTREAARALAVCGSQTGTFYYGNYHGTCPGLTDAVLRSNYGLLPATNPKPTVVVAGGYGASASVTISYTYTFYTLFYLGVSGPTLALNSTAPVVGQQ